MNKISLILVSLSFLFFSCASSPKIEDAKDSEEVMIKSEDEALTIDIEPLIIPSTTYVVVDKDEFTNSEDEVVQVGLNKVEESMNASIVDMKEFIGGTSIFDYNENAQFPIFTKRLSMTTIILNDDEAMVDTLPFMSDTESWQITGDVWESESGSRQLIMIKPKRSGLETNMLIVTNKRLYHFVLYSTDNQYQPMVRFSYKTEPKFITSRTQKRGAKSITIPHYDSVDKEVLSYDYDIKVPLFQKKVMWVPERVYDDGSHTYIKLPKVVLQNELPTVYEDKDTLVNYEVHPYEHNLLIINKLIKEVTLKLGKEKIVVRKKS